MKAGTRYLFLFVGTSLWVMLLLTASRAEPPPLSASAVAPNESGPDEPRQKARIDVLEVKNMDVADVLQLLTKKSGLNIVASKDLAGKVTAFLKDVCVEEALRIILDSNQYAFRKEGTVFRVMPAAEYEARYGEKFGRSYEKRIIRLSFADISDIVKILEPLKSSQGKIIAEAKSSTVFLQDTPDNLALMADLIGRTDRAVMTKVFELRCGQAKELAEAVKDILTEQVGSVQYDERSNKLIVRDTPSRLKAVNDVIRVLDVPERQVLIEAKIVQVILSDQNRYGIDWAAVLSRSPVLNATGKFDILGPNEKGGRLRVGTLVDDDYTVLVEALRTLGDTEILSSPRITALDNQEAKILVGSTEPYVTTTTTTPASGPTTVAESVNFLEVGVKLYVTARIHGDDFVTMKVRPEVSSVTKTILTGNNNTIPVVETSEAETTVRVKDGATVVIGGLIKQERINTAHRVPVLGDIPLVGMAFRSDDKLTRKTEIVIFLTPRIVTGDKGFKYEQTSRREQGAVGYEEN